jgi:hypothetical protein
MDLDETAVVALRPQPRLVEGELSSADLAAVVEWATANHDALLDYWNGAIDTIELGARLTPVRG